MTINDETFRRQDKESGWGNGTLAVRSTESQPAGELCPICVLIMDENLSPEDRQAGEALFAQYMSVQLEITPDGSKQSWHCGMCGAAGEGSIPVFHTRPSSR